MAMFADAMSNFDLHMRNINTNHGVVYKRTSNKLKKKFKQKQPDINSRSILTEL